MSWATWDQAAIAAGLSIACFLALSRLRPGRLRDALLPAFYEFALISALYSIWRLARELPLTHTDGALQRARDIDDVQQFFRLPTEISMQHFVVDHDPLGALVNDYYATLHVPALIIFMIWMFVRHRDAYPHWRNGLAGLTAFCLVIRFVRVAPPRFIQELGFLDLSDKHGFDVYGDVGTGISDQFAAMPSIHVGWAAVVALGVFAVSTSRWRWIVVLHLPITIFVVAATGHHWWLDGFVAIGLLWLSLRADSYVRARFARRRALVPVS
ncbi:inositol phosphorylceramide synthase [Aeromicrobium sp. A1-2]|uniref:phosphatase PAP2 family protein n=1 Tax=Aeromicrobium sp. A1-2 TaxID=2107713 RepID=UPI000E495884|nr:phosphatase PAP2 family protein [Aeromicrobium sp. A1-2]AXT84924.1 inositol phosphorylceramide synthase [Aeromicrobium sp. A1-2]